METTASGGGITGGAPSYTDPSGLTFPTPQFSESVPAGQQPGSTTMAPQTSTPAAEFTSASAPATQVTPGLNLNDITNVNQWAQFQLAAMGLPQTQANIDFLAGWAIKEGGNFNNTARFNPLNTTLRVPGSTVMSGGNTAGVQAYTSWQQGIAATAQTLQGYPQIMAALQSGNASEVDINGGMASDLHKWSGGGYTQVQLGPVRHSGNYAASPVSYPGGAAGAGAGGGLPPTPSTIGALGIAAAQKAFPELAWMLSVPNIASDISTWAAGNYSPDQIAARLAGTDWYQRLGSTFFTWIAQQNTNPAQAKQTLDEARVAITQSFQQMGLQPTTAQIDTFAYEYLAQDWQAHPELANQALADTIATNPDGTFSVKNYTLGANGQMQDTFIGPNGAVSYNPKDFQTTLDASAIANGFVAPYGTYGSPGFNPNNAPAGSPIYALINGKLTQNFDYAKLARGTQLYTLPNMTGVQTPGATGPESHMSGMLQTAEQAANQAAGDYLVPFSGQQAAQLVQQSVQAGLSGQALADHFKTYFQEQAKSLYPSMSAAIDAGITPRAYAAPYQSVVSRLLGVTPDQVDMTDPKYMRFLTQKDPKTGLPIAMSLYDAQQLVMSDPIYGYKKSPDFANRASALAQGLGEMFGKTTSAVPQGFSGVAAPAVPL